MSARTALSRDPSARTGIEEDKQEGGVGAVASIKQVNEDLKKYLNQIEHPQAKEALGKLEEKGVKREYLAYGVGALIGILLIVAPQAKFLANLIGFVYPAIATLSLLTGEPKSSDDQQWLTYWVIFGFGAVLDSYGDMIWRAFPLIYLAKALGFLYLSLPQTKGATIVYQRVLGPALAKLEAKSQ